MSFQELSKKINVDIVKSISQLSEEAAASRRGVAAVDWVMHVSCVVAPNARVA